MRALFTLAFVALTVLGVADAEAVTVRAVADDLDFVAGDVLVVEFTVDDAQGLTGLEFSIVYPSDLLAVEQPSFHTMGTLFSHGFVNHEAGSSDLPAGFQRIGVAFAVATPVASAEGTLLTVSFPIRCSDFSGGWPEGRPVEISVQDVAAWKAQGTGSPAPVGASAEGKTITVDCTTVPVAGAGFSTLKARHIEQGGSR